MAKSDIIKAKNNKAAAVSQLIAGAKKHFARGTLEIPIAGAPTTIDAATNELQALVDNRAAVVAAQAAAKTKLDTERAQMPALNAFVSAFTAFVKVAFRGKSDVLADFGIKPPKARTQLTAEQKAVAAAKRAATREARGTKGPKAKKAVHGNVTAELVVKPGPGATTEAPTPAPAPGPAPAPAPAPTVPTAEGTTPQRS